MRSWVTQRGMQELQTSFHSHFFCSQTVNRDVKIFSILEFRTYKVEFETFVEEFPEKREGMFINLQSHFKFSFPKKLKLLNLRVWCMDKWNSVTKSFPTVSKRWSRTFFSSSQIKGFETLSVPFFSSIFNFLKTISYHTYK